MSAREGRHRTQAGQDLEGQTAHRRRCRADEACATPDWVRIWQGPSTVRNERASLQTSAFARSRRSARPVPSTGGDITTMRDTTLPHATLPPVTCASWCTDGQGHQDELLREDQYCSSDDVRVEVSAMPMVESATGPDRSHLLVGLTTSGPGTPARVTLNTRQPAPAPRHQPHVPRGDAPGVLGARADRHALGPRGGAGPDRLPGPRPRAAAATGARGDAPDERADGTGPAI